jgi:hypothetical protein
MFPGFWRVQLEHVGSYPMCNWCKQKLDARIFPNWVKAFLACVFVLVVLSLVLNWRFIDAYYQLKEVRWVLEHGTDKEAADLYLKISENVSEIPEFAQFTNYHKGRMLLSEDKAAEAFEALKSCQDMPADYGVPVLTLQAEISLSYDKKDYVGFKDASKRLLAYDTSSVALAQVASAYACIYAVQKPN